MPSRASAGVTACSRLTPAFARVPLFNYPSLANSPNFPIEWIFLHRVALFSPLPTAENRTARLVILLLVVACVFAVQKVLLDSTDGSGLQFSLDYSSAVLYWTYSVQGLSPKVSSFSLTLSLFFFFFFFFFFFSLR